MFIIITYNTMYIRNFSLGICLSLFILYSCTQIVEYYETIKLTNTEFSDWSSLIKVNDIVPLGSETDSVFLSLAQKCIIGTNRILFWDYKAKTVYVFNHKGDFLFTAGRRGNARNEYIDLRDVNFNKDESNIEILDLSGIKVYNSENGSFICKREIDNIDMGNFYSFMPYDKKSYLLFSTNKDYSIYQLDSVSVLTGLRERKGYQLVYSHFLYSNTNYVVYPDYGQFTIDNYENGQLKPKYHVDFNGQNLPEEYLPKNYDEFNKTDNMQSYFKSILSIQENSDYLYLRTAGPSQTYYDVFYNKKSGQAYAGPSDKDTGLTVIGASSDTFYALIYPDFVTKESYIYNLIKDYLDKGFMNPLLVTFKIQENPS